MCYRHQLTIALEVVHNMTDGAGWFSFECRRGVLASGLYRLDELSTLCTLLDLTDIEVVS